MRGPQTTIGWWMIVVGVFVASIALGMRMRGEFTSLWPEERMAVAAGLVAVPATVAFLKRLRAGRLLGSAVAAVVISIAFTVWVRRIDEHEAIELLYLASSWYGIATLIAVTTPFLIIRLAFSSKS